jgi:hypothetical protein
MSGPIPAGDYVEHFDPELPHHRAWLQAVLEPLVAHEPQALEEGGSLRRLWTAMQEATSAAPPPSATPPAAIATSRGNSLSVPWFAQLDSATDQARRMGFCSSCVMLLAFLKPGVLSGSSGDDQYLARMRHLAVADDEHRTSGDIIDAAAQIRALASYGNKARITSPARFATLELQIAAGIPVPCVHLHRGPVSSPAGGGHWLIVVGLTPAPVIVHDPLGEADLVNGTTIGGMARFCQYRRQNYRCAGLRLRAALDGGRRGQRLGGVGGRLMSHGGCSRT